jgi:hypothetical protein
VIDRRSHLADRSRQVWETIHAVTPLRRLRKTCSYPAGRRFAAIRRRNDGEGGMTMKALLILVTIFFSANAFAQNAPPKVGNKPLVQVKPKAPQGCKLVGTVKGTKLWAGDCTASESGSAATETPPPLDAQAVGAIPSDPK